MSEEEERSSGDESGARQLQRRGRRSGQRKGRRRGEECDKMVNFDTRKLFSLTRSGSPVIMTECTAAMVLMDLSCSPANRGRMSHASGHSGRNQSHSGILGKPGPLRPTPTAVKNAFKSVYQSLGAQQLFTCYFCCCATVYLSQTRRAQIKIFRKLNIRLLRVKAGKNQLTLRGGTGGIFDKYFYIFFSSLSMRPYYLTVAVQSLN